MKEIVANALTTFEVSPDGGQVRLHCRDIDGEEAALTLPSSSIAELMMTMPKMLQLSLQKQYQDASLRLVHELGTYALERMAGEEKVILTLRTFDGFEVSFGLADKDMAHIALAFGETDFASQPARLM